MPVEPEGPVRPGLAPTRIKIGDPAPVHPCACEAGSGQHLGQQDNRATLFGRDRRTADQAGGQVDWVEVWRCHSVYQSVGTSRLPSGLRSLLQLAQATQSTSSRPHAATHVTPSKVLIKIIHYTLN
jgi:hypothetical protein